MSNAKVLTKNEFDNLIKGGEEKVILIDFWAEWCPPCKVMSPIIDTLSTDEELSQINFYKCDVDSEIDLAGMFSVRSIPTFYLLKIKGDGNFDLEEATLTKIIGAKPAFDFKMDLQNNLPSTK